VAGLNLHVVAKTAIDIALEAGAVLRKGYATDLQLDRKSTETDIVTEYDRRVEALIAERLGETFPDHRLLGEEGGAAEPTTDSAYRWFIDPLDGTNNFAHALPHFCTTLALFHRATPLVGVTYDPLRDEMFYAIKGEGAFLANTTGEHVLRVTENDALITSIVATGFAYDKHISEENNLAEFCAVTKKVRGIRRAGAAALDMAYVAAGRLDGYWELKLNPWDIAAGILLLSEAGGRVATIDDRPLDLNDATIPLLATNGRIHDELQTTLNQAQGLTPEDPEKTEQSLMLEMQTPDSEEENPDG